jgi:hypothetical protein
MTRAADPMKRLRFVRRDTNYLPSSMRVVRRPHHNKEVKLLGVDPLCSRCLRHFALFRNIMTPNMTCHTHNVNPHCIRRTQLVAPPFLLSPLILYQPHMYGELRTWLPEGHRR